MAWYLIKLLIMLPIIGVLIWGSLRLLQKLQRHCNGPATAPRTVRIVETTMLSPTLRLAVLEFRGREILVAVSRQGLTRLAEAEIAS